MSQQPPPYAVGSHTSATPPMAVSSTDTTWAVIAHLASFLGWLTGIGHILVPLLLLLIMGPRSAYVGHHAKEALNYQLSMTIYATCVIVFGILVIFIPAMLFMVEASMLLMLIGLPVLFGLALFDLVVVIVGAAAAGRGDLFRYPLTIRFVR